MNKIALTWVLILLVISIALVPHSLVNAKSKDSKARDAIVKAIGKAVEGKYSTIRLIQLSKSNVSGYVIAYNTTKAAPTPPPPVPPNPPPTPTGTTTKVCLVGDLKGSIVPSLMSKGDCNLKIGLGDLGYGSDLSYFKGLHFDKCVIGNHDATEDGSTALYKEALAYCGDSWSLIIGNSTLVLGFNTNGDIPSQIKTAISAVSSHSGLKTVIAVSHKAGHVPPNSHHPAEAASLYSQLEKSLPSTVTLYEIVGHNHVMSSAPSMNWYQSGAGGKSHYSCGTDQVWTFCDNSNYGYLELTVDNNNGNTAAKFMK